MRAAVYLRQSKDRDGNELAIARQREDCLKLCELRGWEPVQYQDNDASASTGKRPRYEAMLKDISSGGIGAVVVWDLDRLHRRPMELEHFMELADKHSVALATVTGDVDLSTDNGRLFARIKGAVARAEVERKAARQRRAARQAAEDGRAWGGRRAFGYNRDGSLDPNEALFVTDAYAQILRGKTLHSIAKQWNEAGVPTTAGKKWIGSTVRQVLVNPRYAGKRRYLTEEELFDAQWEPIIDYGTWQVVEDILSAPGRRQGSNARKNLLTGIMRCGNCEKLMGSGVAQGGAPIYVCKHCHRNSRRLAPVDELVVRLVLAFLQSPDAANVLTTREEEHVGELLHQEALLIKQVEAIGVDYAEGNLNGAQVRVATKRIEDKLEKVRAKMRSATSGQVFEGLPGGTDPKTWWDALSLDRRRAVVRRLIEPTLHPTVRGRPFQNDQLTIRWLTAQE